MIRNLRDQLGVLTMGMFGVIAILRLLDSGSAFFILLVIRDFHAAFCIRMRGRSLVEVTPFMSAFAYVSTALPLFYRAAENNASVFCQLCSSLLIIAGFTISTLALFDLRMKFGIAPANRGRCTTGLYRVVAHPMYFGYAIAEVGLVIGNSANIFIFAASCAFYILRAKFEERMLDFKHSA